jgi:16S rRNA (guanine527-N7)-methyltransferase
MPPAAPAEINDEKIRDALSPFGIIPTDFEVRSIRIYLDLLLKWNGVVNLTAITDPFEILVRHFGESMFAARLLAVEKCRLADVGSGAGFPGLALKIHVPALDLVLIEANQRKCAFLFEVVRRLELDHVEIRSESYKDIRPDGVLADVIASRAVGDYKELVRWARSALVRTAQVMLWVGGEESTRIARMNGWIWQAPVRIPQSQRRFVLVGQPIAASASAEPDLSD